MSHADKFSVDAADLVMSQCVYCRHRTQVSPSFTSGQSCKAFWGGIPDEILRNDRDHRRPHPDDQGVRFEPRAEVPQAVLDQLFRVLDQLPKG